MSDQPRSAVISIPQHVVFRQFVAETVMLNLRTGQYHGLNPTAGDMLEVLLANGTVERAVSVIAGDYGVDEATVEEDVQELLVGLESRGLIEMAPGPHDQPTTN